MTLFGQTFDGQQLMGLVSLLALIVFWIMVLGRERAHARWFSRWEAGRRARREAEQALRRGPEGEGGPPRGPWG